MSGLFMSSSYLRMTLATSTTLRKKPRRINTEETKEPRRINTDKTEEDEYRRNRGGWIPKKPRRMNTEETEEYEYRRNRGGKIPKKPRRMNTEETEEDEYRRNRGGKIPKKPRRINTDKTEEDEYRQMVSTNYVNVFTKYFVILYLQIYLYTHILFTSLYIYLPPCTFISLSFYLHNSKGTKTASIQRCLAHLPACLHVF